MDVKTMLRGQMKAMHDTMEQAIGDCSGEMIVRKAPASKINTIGAIYAHSVMSEDGILNALVRGGVPVYYADGWAPKIGIEMPRGGMEPDWDVTMDLGLFRQYASAVYDTTDKYLASATDDELDRVVNLGFAPPMSVGAVVANVLAWHTATHQGEISALKGVQGVEGLVFAH